MGLGDLLLKPIEDWFNRIFGGTVIGRLVDKIIEGVGHITTLVQRITDLIDSIKSEITAFTNWKEDINFKHKVINVPKAVEHTADLIDELKAGWQAILDLVKDIKEKAGGENAEAEAEEVASDLEGGAGESLLRRLPRLSRGFEKLLGVVTIVVDAVISWSDAVDKLQTIVNAVRDLREEVETGSTIFLSQKNGRRKLALAEGGSIKIRVGNLHS